MKYLLALSLLINLKYCYSLYRSHYHEETKDIYHEGRMKKLEEFSRVMIDTGFIGDSHIAFMDVPNNLGIGGLKASELKKVRLQVKYPTILIGINDIICGQDPTKDIDTILTQYENYRLLPVMKVNERWYDSKRINKEVDRVNEYLKKYRLATVPFTKELPDSLTSDYVHLNRQGYRLLLKSIL